MNNAEKFKQMFGFYATEMWAKSEQEFLDWINAEYVKKNSWIPCSERLPEENYWTGGGRQFSDIMLVTCVHHANDNEHFVDMAETVDGAWRFIRETKEGYGFLPDCCEVIAWMPLPEPYKGETDKDYERAVEQMEHDTLYEPTYNSEDGSM